MENSLSEFIFRKEIKKQREVISMLENFIQQLYWGYNLDSNESKKNLEESLIEITKYGKHASNGILISENGYFLTAKHCISRDLFSMKIRLYNGLSYPIEKVCVEYGEGKNLKNDLALVKAKIPNKSLSKTYRIFNTLSEIGTKKLPLIILTRREGEVNTSGGFLEEFSCEGNVKLSRGYSVSKDNHFLLNAFVKPGDSGGIIVTADEGKLIGLVSHAVEKHPIVYGAKIIKALELVDFYRRGLEMKFGTKP
jgi:S1-C subfamily serine protease